MPEEFARSAHCTVSFERSGAPLTGRMAGQATPRFGGYLAPKAAELARWRFVDFRFIREGRLVACGVGDAVGVGGAKASRTISVARDRSALLEDLIVVVPNEFAAETSDGSGGTAGARTGAGFAGGSGLVEELIGGTGRHAGLVAVGVEPGLAGETEGRVAPEAVEAVGGAGAAGGGGRVPVLRFGASEGAGGRLQRVGGVAGEAGGRGGSRAGSTGGVARETGAGEDVVAQGALDAGRVERVEPLAFRVGWSASFPRIYFVSKAIGLTDVYICPGPLILIHTVNTGGARADTYEEA